MAQMPSLQRFSNSPLQAGAEAAEVQLRYVRDYATVVEQLRDRSFIDPSLPLEAINREVARCRAGQADQRSDGHRFKEQKAL